MPRAKAQKTNTATKTATRKSTKKTKATMPKETKTVKVTPKVQAGINQEEEVAGRRYFKCIMINADGKAVCSGRYSGKKPKQAASKACTRLYKDAGKKFPKNIVFGMHECTRTSKKKKKYFYVGSRTKLAKPEKVSINKKDPKTGKNMVITYNYNNQVRKLSNTAGSDEYKLLFNYDVVNTPAQEGGNVEPVVEVQESTSQTGGSKRSTRKTTAKKTTAKKTTAKKTASPKKKNLKVVSKTKTARKSTKKTQ